MPIKGKRKPYGTMPRLKDERIEDYKRRLQAHDALDPRPRRMQETERNLLPDRWTEEGMIARLEWAQEHIEPLNKTFTGPSVRRRPSGFTTSW